MAPALQRQLHHASWVRGFASKAGLAAAALALVTSVGAGVPAYASVIEQQQQEAKAPEPQSLSVTGTPASALTVDRDAYGVYVPPALQYPLDPVTGVTSGYGPRGGRMHEGVDIFPGAGTPIHAMAAGVVIAVNRPSYSAMGQHVVLQHVIDGQVVTSVYAHMINGSIAVSVGQQVLVGQVLGLVGETGNAQGAHLHFEIRPGGGAPVNPYQWIAARL